MPARRHLIALGACAALFLSPGCGSSDDEPEGEPLPAGTVSAIERRLGEVQRRYDAGTQDGNAGACQDIENDSYKAIDDLVSEIPQDVDADIREALEASVARLKELTSEGCADVKEEPAQTETEAPEPVTPPPVTEEPPPAQTQTQPTTPEEKEPPPNEEEDGNNGNGQGNGNGEGNGNGSGGQPAPPAPEG